MGMDVLIYIFIGSQVVNDCHCDIEVADCSPKYLENSNFIILPIYHIKNNNYIETDNLFFLKL